MMIILFFLKNLNQFINLLNAKLVIGSGLLSVKIILAKVKLKNVQKKYFSLILCSKVILGRIQSKI